MWFIVKDKLFNLYVLIMYQKFKTKNIFITFKNCNVIKERPKKAVF